MQFNDKVMSISEAFLRLEDIFQSADLGRTRFSAESRSPEYDFFVLCFRMLPEKLFAAVLVETVVEVHVRPADAYREDAILRKFHGTGKRFHADF